MAGIRLCQQSSFLHQAALAAMASGILPWVRKRKMCPVHLLDSWYSLALAAPHSKYFFTWKNQDSQKHLEAQSERETSRSHVAHRHDWTWAQCRRQPQKRGNVFGAQPFLKSTPTTSTQAGVQIAITGNGLRCCSSSSWRERGQVCDLANLLHSQQASYEGAPCKHTDRAVAGGHVCTSGPGRAPRAD